MRGWDVGFVRGRGALAGKEKEDADRRRKLAFVRNPPGINSVSADLALV